MFSRNGETPGIDIQAERSGKSSEEAMVCEVQGPESEDSPEAFQRNSEQSDADITKPVDTEAKEKQACVREF